MFVHDLTTTEFIIQNYTTVANVSSQDLYQLTLWPNVLNCFCKFLLQLIKGYFRPSVFLELISLLIKSQKPWGFVAARCNLQTQKLKLLTCRPEQKQWSTKRAESVARWRAALNDTKSPFLLLEPPKFLFSTVATLTQNTSSVEPNKHQ